ncbi:MAG: phosphate/phosphite/phosphonate ABC transporter substrate-binding protein [Phycisphaeraceae bacterium]|nr:phosphate/phosphite/phosphonate ABC transporter substrate-binding protein [Phycisphaeraceae bacterium]
MLLDCTQPTPPDPPARGLSKLPIYSLLAGIMALLLQGCGGQADGKADGADGESAASGRVLQVMLIPADTGADTTLDDFRPVFNAISEHHGLQFDLKVGTSYAAVVEGMANEQIDIAFLGPVTLYQAQQRDAAELLAVAVKKGESSYHSIILTRADSGIKDAKGLAGKSIALGDANSTSSFQYPVAMILKAGLDPVKDLERIVITGSHSNAIAALKEGHVDAAGCSLNAFEKAVKAGIVDNDAFKAAVVSPGIPNPPLAMHPKLPEGVKATLREAFGTIHEAEGVTPEMIRGYGGAQYDRYDTEFPQSRFDEAMVQLAPVTKELVGEIVESVADTTSSIRAKSRAGERTAAK